MSKADAPEQKKDLEDLDSRVDKGTLFERTGSTASEDWR